MKTKKMLVVSVLLMLSTGIVTATPADLNCGTVIVGAGGAGVRAAIELKEHGKNVCLVEKMPFIGGSSNLAASYFSVINTKEQRAAGKGGSLEGYIATHQKVNPNLSAERVKELQSGGQEALDWLNSLGANITRPISSYQIAQAEGRSLGSTIMSVMSKKLKEVGVTPILNTKAIKINVKGDTVTGVVVENKAGEKYTINAPNVILATGGFASSQDAVKKYAPQWQGTASTSAKGSTGDALEMAKAIGANLKFMDYVRMNPSVYIDKNGQASSLSVMRAEGGIMVNLDGKRFCNDYFPDYTQLSKWILKQKNGEVFVIVDSKAMNKSKRMQGFRDKGYFIVADTIPELAKKMGVPVKNLAQTIKNYQEAVRTGEDKEFGRKFNLSIDFTQPPFYAAKTKPGIQVTLGGIEVNKEFEVINKEGKPIKGLYAVGEVAHDGLFGSSPTVVNTVFGKKVADYIIKKDK